MEEFSRTHVRKEDLILETELRIAREMKYSTFRCPCRRCHGGRRYSVESIRQHLREYGRDPFLMCSMVGGDPDRGYPEQGIWVNGNGDTIPHTNVFDDSHLRTEYGDQLDPFHDIQQQVFEAFDMGDSIRENDQPIHEQDMAEELRMGGTEMDFLYEQATQTVYEGVNVSVISAIIVLINMAVIHGVSNVYMDELLKYLSTTLLPAANRLPQSYYQGQKIRFAYSVIHACPDGCVLFQGTNENLTHCPNVGCGKARYVQGSEVVPARVIRHFPLIPRLLRMYRSPAIADLLQHHFRHPNTDDQVMKSVVDSPAWKHVDAKVDPSFADEVRNLRFGLSLDGVNPFAHNSTSHSTWPILVLIYNLLPYLVPKKFFIQLCILVSGKLSPTNKNIDVFLSPLIEELQELWVGVTAQDFSRPVGSRRFNMRGILMWTISNYPAYGLISGLCTHSYKACTGPDTEARCATSGNNLDSHRRAKGRKMVYGDSRRWTKSTHHTGETFIFMGRKR